ncbi:class I SAM-dependent methyltransferase [Nocardia sp. NPDC088792]|uniref:class I SAM-dependent methyltransferase n=1 Tax=Nocardia sp. NPDC088792 TaxID=3364332 RepID=UPI00382CCCDF
MTDPHPPAEFFETAYRNRRPDDRGLAGWDIGRPQTAVIELEEAGEIGGEVLDIGCGSGENALYLVARGHTVTGIDAAPAALALARQKAADRGLELTLDTADAREMTGYEGRFDTVLDSGLFHVFDETDRKLYVDALHRVTKAGARVHILAVSDSAPAGPGPRRITPDELLAAFESGWTVDTLRHIAMLGRLPGLTDGDIPGLLLTARRQ